MPCKTHRARVIGSFLRAAWLAAALIPATDAAAIWLASPQLSIAPNSTVQSNLRLWLVANASALGDFDSAVDALDKTPAHWDDPVFRAGQVVADSTRGHPVHAEAEFRARAQIGTLKTMTRAKVEHGAASAIADVYLQFMDQIQITREGKLTVLLAVGKGGIKNQLHPTSSTIAAGSQARADFYVWPVGTMPQPGQFFDFTTYMGATWTEAGPILTEREPPRTFLAGTRYWVLGQLWLSSSARGGSAMQVLEPRSIETQADLYHTAQFFIAPDASTPLAAFRSASGFDYLLPVPEPSTWLLNVVGMAMVCALRKGSARYRQGMARGQVSG